MKVIYNRNLKNLTEINEEVYSIIYIFKKGQCDLYRFNDAINIKLDLIIEHLNINRPISVKQSHLIDLGSPIPQISNASEVNSELTDALEK